MSTEEDETEMPDDDLSDSSGVGSESRGSEGELKKYAAPNIMDIMEQAQQMDAQKVKALKKDAVLFGEGWFLTMDHIITCLVTSVAKHVVMK